MMESPALIKYRAVSDRLLAAACAIAIGAFLICQIWDIDIWWHLAIGRDILARHAVPVTDHFTAAAFGRPYHDSQWLFQVVMALTDKAAGMVGVQTMMILGWSAVFWFCRRAILRNTSSLEGHMLLFLAAMASTERFHPRPEIITLMMIVLFWQLLLERKYENTKELLLFGLLQVIWTNSHGLFVIGPFMAGCYWLTAILQKKQDDESQNLIELSKLLGVLLMATLITPYGWKGWRFAAQLFIEVGPWAPKLLKEIGELSPTFGTATRGGIAFWFFMALLAATVLTAIPLTLRRQISLSRLLIVAGLFAAAMTGRRNMPLFAIIAAPFIAENLRLLLPQGIITNARIKATITATLILAMLTWAWYPISGTHYINSRTPSRFGLGITPSFFPHNLPQILKQTGFKGQIYNSNPLGGFYLYHGYPEHLPLTDGRFEIYDAKTLEAIYDAPNHPETWASLVNTYNIRGLLLQHTAPDAWVLLPMLRSKNDWRLVYYDHAVSFWMRNDTPSLPPEIDLATAPLPPEPGRIEDCLILNMFLSQIDANEMKLRNLERATRFGSETEFVQEQIGDAQIRLQRFDQAEETFRALLRDHPKNLAALDELGFLAYRKGDLVTAETMLRRALEIAPDDIDIRNNYSRIKEASDRSTLSRAAQ